MMRQCKKCGNIFEATAKTQRKCESCKEIRGRPTYNPQAHKFAIDPKKLMALKKKLDKMSYARAIE